MLFSLYLTKIYIIIYNNNSRLFTNPSEKEMNEVYGDIKILRCYRSL